MDKFKKLVMKLNGFMSVIAGVTLVLVMLLTVLDVTLRYFGHPITGVYDLVALGGAVIIGFTIPYAAERKIHVFMEMAQQMQSRTVRQTLYAFTRLIALSISFVIAWNLVKLGTGFRETGEASLTVQIAYYPIAIGLGACFLMQGMVFLIQLFEGSSGGGDE
jgi:TRAP-type C4-dicarboxylate transport system permease small subunit